RSRGGSPGSEHLRGWGMTMSRSVARSVAETSVERELLGLIEARRARVGVIGLGYVGLPLACTFAEGGFPVLGFDSDPAKIEALAAGRSYIHHLPATRIGALAGRLVATTDLARLGRCDAILVCVPTPLTAAREPDLSYVVQSAEAVARALRP